LEANHGFSLHNNRAFMLLQLFDQPQLLIILIFCLIFALSLHEFAHALVANWCGDSTAKMLGRLTTNPMAHLDPFGALMLLMVGFGYAKPVPVNPRNFRFRNADFYVAAAGPGMNLLLGIASGLLWRMISGAGVYEFLGMPLDVLFFWFMFINFNLCLFNLIPLGPLDGSYVLPHFLPRDLQRRYEVWNERFGGQLLMGLVALSLILPGFSAFRWISSFSRSLVSWAA
jgi:Zn-dependent protease